MGFLNTQAVLIGLTLLALVHSLPFSAGSTVLAADPGVGGGLLQFLILFGPLFLIWYLLVIRPQQTQKKKVQEMLANLKTGDRVLTTGGLYGTVVGFREGVVQLQVAKEVKVDVARSAISGLQTTEAEAGNSKSKEAGSGKK